jgi:hypothetical protein
MLLHTKVGDVTAVAGENFGLRQADGRAFFVGIAKKKFAGFDGRAGAGSWFLAHTFDAELRETVTIAEVLVCVGEGRDGFEIQ